MPAWCGTLYIADDVAMVAKYFAEKRQKKDSHGD